MAKLLDYWDAANCRDLIYLEVFSAVKGTTVVIPAKLHRIESGMLIYTDDTQFGHGCMQKDYNVWDIFGWRPWNSEPTDEERIHETWAAYRR